MNNFIEQHKKFLKFYHVALRLSGWILLTLGIGVSGFYTFLIVRNIGINKVGIISLVRILWFYLDFILLGLLGLGLAQLIRYLVDDKYKSGFILRHGDKILYAYTILFLIVSLIGFVFTTNSIASVVHSVGEKPEDMVFVQLFISIVLFSAKALIIIGLAEFLKRIMPVIEEHKSLI